MDKLNECIFLTENDDLLEKYNTIWDKVNADIQNLIAIKNLIASLSIDFFFLETKIKSYGDEVTDFYDNEIPKVDSNYTCLSVISLDSAFKKDKNYYLQVFLIV